MTRYDDMNTTRNILVPEEVGLQLPGVLVHGFVPPGLVLAADLRQPEPAHVSAARGATAALLVAGRGRHLARGRAAREVVRGAEHAVEGEDLVPKYL